MRRQEKSMERTKAGIRKHQRTNSKICGHTNNEISIDKSYESSRDNSMNSIQKRHQYIQLQKRRHMSKNIIKLFKKIAGRE